MLANSQTCVRHVIPLISTVTRHISNSDTAYARDIPWKKRTGRGYANDLMFRDLRHFTLANKKCFTRTMARLVGVDSSLERTMLMLDVGKKPKQRKLCEAKRNRIGRMFMEQIIQILCEHDQCSLLEGVELQKVDVSPTFKVMTAYWIAKGDESDQITENILKKSENFVRKRLSESLGSHNIPCLTFVAERKHLLEKEMIHLFEKADYGMQYRALSHTGAVLGSMSETGIPSYEPVLSKDDKIGTIRDE